MNFKRFLPPSLARAAGVVLAMSDRMSEINIGLVSAGVAFYGLLAVFPTMTAIVALWGLFADPAVVVSEVQTLEPMMPEEGYAILERQVESLASGASATLGWASAASLLAALWASRSGVAAIIGGLNKVHDSRSRGGIMHVIVAMSLSATMILAALVALASVVVAPVALALLPLGPYTGFALDLMRWVAGIGIVLLAIGLLYRFGPSEKAVRPVWRRAGVITPGAIVAVALWAFVSWGFSTYLENFGNYDRVYGSLGAVIALLMWLYLSGFVVLLGAIVDVEVARAAARGAPGGTLSEDAVSDDSLAGDPEDDEPSPAAPAPAESPGRA